MYKENSQCAFFSNKHPIRPWISVTVCATLMEGNKLTSWQKETIKQHKLIQFYILGQFWKKLSHLCAVFYFQLQAFRIYSNARRSFIITAATARILSQLQCQTDKKQAWNNCRPSNKLLHYPTPVFLWLKTLNSMLHPWTGSQWRKWATSAIKCHRTNCWTKETATNRKHASVGERETGERSCERKWGETDTSHFFDNY